MCLVSLSYSLMRVHSATGEAETIYSVNALNARENVAVHSVRARCSVLIACKGFTGDR